MALESDDLDLLLDSDGDLVVTNDLQMVSGIDAVTQLVRIAILEFKGNWFLDLNLGVPYFQELLGHKFNASRAATAFRRVVLSVPEVVEILKMDVQFIGTTRQLQVSWEARTEFGDTASTEII